MLPEFDVEIKKREREFHKQTVENSYLVLSHEVKVTYFKLLPFTHRMNECIIIWSRSCVKHMKRWLLFLLFSSTYVLNCFQDSREHGYLRHAFIVTGFFPMQPRTVYGYLKDLCHPSRASNEEFTLQKSLFSVCAVVTNHPALLGLFSDAHVHLLRCCCNWYLNNLTNQVI